MTKKELKELNRLRKNHARLVDALERTLEHLDYIREKGQFLHGESTAVVSRDAHATLRAAAKLLT